MPDSVSVALRDQVVAEARTPNIEYRPRSSSRPTPSVPTLGASANVTPRSPAVVSAADGVSAGVACPLAVAATKDIAAASARLRNMEVLSPGWRRKAGPGNLGSR